MKAIIYEEYGLPDVLKIKELEKPSPKENEILVRVCSAHVNYGDLLARNFKNISMSEFNMPSLLWLPSRIAFGFSKPKIKILGSEFSGVVESVGTDVKKFKKGDEVFGYLGLNMGAYAEYVCVPENKSVVVKPSNMTFEEAACIPYGALMALGILRKVNIRQGQKILISGASGGIGSLALQLAKYFGAEVTGVCGSPRIEYVKSLGADKVIDYANEDFTRNGEKYDIIFDILGRGSFSRIKNSLSENGIYLLASFKMKKLLQMLWTSVSGGKKVICAFASEKQKDLLFIKELIETGKIKSVVDKCFPMYDASEAHRYAESKMKRGNVVINIADRF